MHNFHILWLCVHTDSHSWSLVEDWWALQHAVAIVFVCWLLWDCQTKERRAVVCVPRAGNWHCTTRRNKKHKQKCNSYGTRGLYTFINKAKHKQKCNTYGTRGLYIHKHKTKMRIPCSGLPSVMNALVTSWCQGGLHLFTLRIWTPVAADSTQFLISLKEERALTFRMFSLAWSLLAWVHAQDVYKTYAKQKKTHRKAGSHD